MSPENCRASWFVLVEMRSILNEMRLFGVIGQKDGGGKVGNYLGPGSVWKAIKHRLLLFCRVHMR